MVLGKILDGLSFVSVFDEVFTKVVLSYSNTVKFTKEEFPNEKLFVEELEKLSAEELEEFSAIVFSSVFFKTFYSNIIFSKLSTFPVLLLTILNLISFSPTHFVAFDKYSNGRLKVNRVESSIFMYKYFCCLYKFNLNMPYIKAGFSNLTWFKYILCISV